MRRSVLPFLILSTLSIGMAHAQSATGTTASSVWSFNSTDDWTLSVFDSLIPTGSNDNVVAGSLGMIALGVSGVAAAWLMFAFFIKSHEIMETSKVIANGFNGFVVPRLVIMGALILPVPGAGGMTAGMLVVKGMLRGAVGLARTENNAMISLIGPKALPLATPQSPGTREVVQGVIAAEFCRALLNAASNNENFVPAPKSGASSGGAGGRTYRYGLAEGNGFGRPACGAVAIDFPALGTQDTSYLSLSDVSAAEADALDRLVTNVRAAVTPIATQMWEKRDASVLRKLDDVLSTQANLYAQSSSAAVSQAISAVRTKGGQDNDPGIAEMRRLGWTGAGAYYFEIGRLNGQILSLSSLTPTVLSPNYAGMGGYLALDTAPLVHALTSYQEEQDERLALMDNSSVTGQVPDLEASNSPGEPSGSSAPLNWVLRKAHLNERLLNLIMSSLAAPSAGSGWTDPMASMISLGHLMIHTSVLTQGAISLLSSKVTRVGELFSAVGNAVVGDFPGAAASLASLGISQMLANMSSAITGLLMAMFLPGVFLAFVLPMIPFLYFFSGVAGWMVMAVELIVTVPFWGLAHAVLQGEGWHGRGQKGYEFLFNVMFRPALMIIALQVSYVLFSALSWFLMKGFSIAAAFALERGWLLDNLVGILVYLSLFVAAEVKLAMVCFRLISTIPHHAVEFVSFHAVGRIDHDDFVDQSSGSGTFKSQDKAMGHIKDASQGVLSAGREQSGDGKNSSDKAGGDAMDSTTRAIMRSSRRK